MDEEKVHFRHIKKVKEMNKNVTTRKLTQLVCTDGKRQNPRPQTFLIDA